jgi:hypothetical protein
MNEQQLYILYAERVREDSHVMKVLGSFTNTEEKIELINEFIETVEDAESWSISSEPTKVFHPFMLVVKGGPQRTKSSRTGGPQRTKSSRTGGPQRTKSSRTGGPQ